MSLSLISTGDNLSKINGWGISLHTAREQGREVIEGEFAGGTVLTGTSVGPGGEQ